VARDLCSKATLQPRWTQSGPKKRGRGNASQGKAREEGWRDGGGERAPRWCCPKRDTFEHCSLVSSKGWGVPERSPEGWGVGFRPRGYEPQRLLSPSTRLGALAKMLESKPSRGRRGGEEGRGTRRQGACNCKQGRARGQQPWDL